MRKAVIYIHGKGGKAEEAMHYRPLFPDCDVIGFEYKAQTPWEAERVGATLTVMPGGEHWFHTEEQMAFLDRWIKLQGE